MAARAASAPCPLLTWDDTTQISKNQEEARCVQRKQVLARHMGSPPIGDAQVTELRVIPAQCTLNFNRVRTVFQATQDPCTHLFGFLISSKRVVRKSAVYPAKTINSHS